LSWPAATGATGYVVRWGHAKDKLHHSQDVRSGTQAVVECLTGGEACWFTVDSFNDNGITFNDQAIPDSTATP
jgi:xylan 1,4-beta-xylosidase